MKTRATPLQACIAQLAKHEFQGKPRPQLRQELARFQSRRHAEGPLPAITERIKVLRRLLK